MSCRATCSHPPLPLRPVTCEDCGMSDLHTFYTSKERGVHLCPTCFGSRIERGIAKEREPQTSEACGARSTLP